MDPDLKLDPSNPPKYCPQCAKNGLKTKVKKFKLDPTSEDLTIMCKNGECPWPFSAVSDPTEARVKSSSGKKRKKEKVGGKTEEVQSELGVKGATVVSSSPDSKKLRLSPSPPSPPSTTCDREVAGILVNEDTDKVANYSAHSSLLTDLRVSPTPTEEKGETSNTVAGFKPTFLNILNTPVIPGDSPKHSPHSLNILNTPVMPCDSPKHSPHSPSLNIPSPGTAFSLVSPKRRQSQESDQDGKASLNDPPDKPGKDTNNTSDDESKDYDMDQLDFEPEEKPDEDVVELQEKPEVESFSDPFDLNEESPVTDMDGDKLKETASNDQFVKDVNLEESKDSSNADSKKVIALEEPVKDADVEVVKKKSDVKTVASGAEWQGGETEEFSFTAMPVAVRKPLHLPKHAANILSSRPPSPSTPKGEERGASSPDEDEMSYLSDADDSDSELESLASECSTMSAMSESSGGGEEGEGQGKKKRRGRKKKRKDRRKAHVGKCTKEGPRMSDLNFLAKVEEVSAPPESEKSTEKPPEKSLNEVVHKSEEVLPAVVLLTGTEPPMVTLDHLVLQEVMSNPTPTPPVVMSTDPTPCPPMSISPLNTDKLEVFQTVPSISVSPAQPMSVSPEETPRVLDETPCSSPQLDSDPEMEFLVNVRPAWSSGVSNPVSPMSVTESEPETLDLASRRGHTPLSLRRKVHLPRTRFRSAEQEGRKGLKVMLPKGGAELSESESETEAAHEDPEQQDAKIKDQENEENNAEETESLDNQTPDETVTPEVTVNEPVKEDDVFKPPLLPTPSPAFRPSSLPSSGQTFPSPSMSSLASPGHSTLPSPNYQSLPNLLSPMPATPKSIPCREEVEVSSSQKSSKSEELEKSPLKLSLVKSLNKNWTVDKTHEEKSPTKPPGLEKLVSKLKNENTKENESEEEIVRIQSLIESPYPRRRGRKSKAKKFGQDDLSGDSESSATEKETEELMRPPPGMPPKRGRGRPPKNKTPVKQEGPGSKPTTPNIDEITTSESPSKVETISSSSNVSSPKVAARSKMSLFEDYPSSPDASSSPKTTTSSRISLAADDPAIGPKSCFSPPNASSSPRTNTSAKLSLTPQLGSNISRTIPLKVLRPVKGLPPGLVPCAPPPGLVPCAPPPGLRRCPPPPSAVKPVTTSLFDIEDTETDFVDKVKKAIEQQNLKAKEVPRSEVFAEELTEETDAERGSNMTEVKKPQKTFERVPKKEKGTSLTSLSNKFFLNTGINIEAVALPQEQQEAFVTLPTKSLLSFPEEDPDFATVRKLGSGSTLDNDLSRSEGLETGNSSSTLTSEQSVSDNSNSVVFHVATSALINQPLEQGNLQVKEQGNTRVLLTAQSNQIEVHDLKNATTRPYVRPPRGRGKAARGGGFAREGVSPLHPSQPPEEAEEELSGVGWFKWNNWKVDEAFILGFQAYIKNLVSKWHLPPNDKIDPRIQALLKEKEDNTTHPETVQQIIAFFAEVFVKYLYIRTNFPVMSVIQVLDILKNNYKLVNTQFSAHVRSVMSQRHPQPPLQSPTPNLPTSPVPIVARSPVKSTIVIRRPVNSAPLAPEVKERLISSALQAVPQSPHQEGLAGRMAHLQAKFSTPLTPVRLSTQAPVAHSTPTIAIKSRPPPPSVITQAPQVTPPINMTRTEYINVTPPASPPQWDDLENPNSVSVDNPNSVSVINPPSVSDFNPPSVSVINRSAVSVRWGDLENPNSVSVDNPSSVSFAEVPSVGHYSSEVDASGVTVKSEPGLEPPPAHRGPLPSQDISSCQVYSVYNDGGCSVEMNSVNSTSRNEAIGQGSKVLQFFYQSGDNVKIAFTPVLVNTEEEVNCVVALVTEKNDEFNRRNKVTTSRKPVQYFSSAVQARSILQPDVVRHIEKCFTKKGMKEAKVGKRRSYPKRRDIKIVGKEYFNIKQEKEDIPGVEEEAEAEEEEEEAEDDPDEYVPNENEMKMALEAKVFGAYMPKSTRKVKPPRYGISDRKGRGGRNENVDKNAPETLVLGAVEYMLGKRLGEEKDDGIIQSTLNLNFLTKKGRRRRRKVNIDLDNLSDEDEEFKGPNIKKADRLSGDRVRKSRRLNATTNNTTEGEDQGDEVEPKDINLESKKANEVITEVISGQQSEELKREAPGQRLTGKPVVEPVGQVAEQSDPEREEKIKEVKKFCHSQMTPLVSKSTNKDDDNLFSKPDTSSDEDKSDKKERLRRGRISSVKPQLTPGDPGEVDEMIRAVSRAGSRPGSQADSRPGSQMSRPGSALPRKVARQLESLGSPERDSPVLAPRQRQLKKEARGRDGFESLHLQLNSSKGVTPDNKSPVRAGQVNENYLKKDVEDVHSIYVVDQSDESLGNFTQAFSRKKQSEKVKKMLEKQKRKAEKISNKKYKGFGEESDPVADEKLKKKEEKARKKKEVKIKKAQVSAAESDLMKELLNIGTCAVAESKHSSSEIVACYDNTVNTSNVKSEVEAAAIKEFEELQTLEGETETSTNLSEELDSLFDLS